MKENEKAMEAVGGKTGSFPVVNQVNESHSESSTLSSVTQPSDQDDWSTERSLGRRRRVTLVTLVTLAIAMAVVVMLVGGCVGVRG